MSAMIEIFLLSERLKCSIQLGKVEFHKHSPNKIFAPLHKWENINFFVYITCTKIQIVKQLHLKQNIIQTAPGMLKVGMHILWCRIEACSA